jgi:uncharacterized protein YndB with AHSA1/START domain
MPVARRARTLAASPQELWSTVGDPHHLPRWWPHVRRVEAVTKRAFTEVLVASDEGRPVRADFRVAVHEPPRRRVWDQQLEGSPFERVFAAVRVGVELTPAEGGTRVELRVEQRLRGASKLGAPLAKRGAKRLLDQALDALEDLHQGV